MALPRVTPEEKILHRKAVMAVKNEVRTGRMRKPTMCQAEAPSHSSGRIEAHHYLGYARKYWLAVRWLCTRCHRIADTQQAYPNGVPTSATRRELKLRHANGGDGTRRLI